MVIESVADPIESDLGRGPVNRIRRRSDRIRSRRLTLAPGERRRECLGADDTAGVWLCRELILSGVPGHYVFHAGEEVGCVGSRALVMNAPDLLAGITIAIALDRAGTGDVVTHQYGQRGASEAFAASMGQALAAVAPAMQYESAHGVYTDTAEYMGHVAECTNLSVGYARQHSPEEWLDVDHLIALRAALIDLDTSSLVVARVPGRAEPEPDADRWPAPWPASWPASWDAIEPDALDPDDAYSTRSDGRASWGDELDHTYLDRAIAEIQRRLRKDTHRCR